MAYIRPCNKCGQRISMREMRAGQWVAFDASTQTPHKCGKKTKADPKIKDLAKEKLKEKISEGVDLGYSDIEVKNPTPDKVEEINSKIEEVYYESEIYKEIEVLEERLENIKEKQGINFEKIGGVKTPLINQERQEIEKSSEDGSIKKDPPVFSDTDNVIFKIAGALILAGFLFGLFSSL